MTEKKNNMSDILNKKRKENLLICRKKNGECFFLARNKTGNVNFSVLKLISFLLKGREVFF